MCLTRTQVEYWKYKEDKRHNRATEAQNKYHLVTERGNLKVSASRLRNETKLGKYNAITQRLAANETRRHNQATESLTATDIAEKTRHNQAYEGIQSYNAQVGKYNALTQRATAQTKTYDAKTKRFAQTAESAFKNAKSVTDFANAMTKAKLSTTAKIYIFEELLLNPNISSASKTRILNYMKKAGLYRDGDYMRQATDIGKGPNMTGKQKGTNAYENQKRKFAHK